MFYKRCAKDCFKNQPFRHLFMQ